MMPEVHTVEPGASSLTLEELRARKRSILRSIDQCEHEVEELRRQALMYQNAADKLRQRLTVAESQERESAARGDSKTAAGLHQLADEIRGLTHHHTRLSAERSHLADGRQVEIGHHGAILAKIETLMHQRLESIVFGTPIAGDVHA
jgi:predicted RNase H-like nuclease (RuvC/YqgF family)